MGGVQFMGRMSASLSLPIAVVNKAGRDPQAYGVGTGGISDSTTAVHDMRLDFRFKAYESDDGKLRVGGDAAMFLPTGNSTAFTGDGQVTGWLLGLAEYNFDKFLLAGQIGPHFRPERSIGGQYGALFLASELRWAIGAYVPLREGKLRVGGEIFGSTGLSSGLGPNDDANTIFSGKNTPLEWMGEARFLIDSDPQLYVNAGFGTRLSTGYGAPDFRALVSIGRYIELTDSTAKAPPRKVHVVPTPDDYDLDTDGDGYPDAVDKCPSLKEDGKPPDPTDGCPGNSDRDGDGIPDAKDVCPDKAEDKDGVQDEDGCPETDADNDTIPDQQDRCPLQPGPRSDVAERNGCPNLTRVSESGEVELLQPIEFETGKAVIKPASYPILDEVVTLMKARHNLRIGVYGHTDNKGSLALNMRLSKDRAHACLKYLVDKGIAASRLESEGFGPNQPIADNATDEGRAKNRRVEFKILGGSE
jgi:outer membrane protein OmpA-like peptidoglycan-associated protein